MKWIYDSRKINIMDIENETVPFFPNTSVCVNGTLNRTEGTDNYLKLLISSKTINEIINCVFIIACAPFIIGGNIMVILSVIRFRRLKTVMNLFITSLALADLLVGFPTIPLYVLFYLNKEVQGIKKLCLLKYMFVLISLPASILNLLIVTIDRFIAVNHPLHYASLMTKRRAKFMIAGVWIYSIGSASLPLMGVNTWVQGSICDFWAILPKTFTMIVVPGVIIVALPSNILMYVKILSTARKIKRRIVEYKTKMSFNGHKLNRDTRMAKIMGFVFLAFLIFWTPFFTASLLKYLNFHVLIIEMVKECAVSLTMANSLVNPIIYGWVKPDFRKAFKKILHIKQTSNQTDIYLHDSETDIHNNSSQRRTAVVFKNNHPIAIRHKNIQKCKSDTDIYRLKPMRHYSD